MAFHHPEVRCDAQGLSCSRRRSLGEGASEIEWIDNEILPIFSCFPGFPIRLISSCAENDEGRSEEQSRAGLVARRSSGSRSPWRRSPLVRVSIVSSDPFLTHL